jgi:type I restriction enzyme R subunit
LRTQQENDQIGRGDCFLDPQIEAPGCRQLMGDDALRMIARELVATVRANVTIDWTVRDNVRAQLRVLVKRILRKYGYPPDKQEKATQTVLEQAEVLSQGWTLG